jgi:hypothetical protein
MKITTKIPWDKMHLDTAFWAYHYNEIRRLHPEYNLEDRNVLSGKEFHDLLPVITSRIIPDDKYSILETELHAPATKN